MKERLAELAAETAATHHCPSIEWGVVRAGELVYDSGAPDTVYRIASMTKSFTAATVLALRDEGAIELDRPIADYAGELAPVLGPPGSARITVRHLLSMASGLATDDVWADRHLDIDEAAIDAIYAAGPSFAYRPGTAYEYSNLGYAMIGRVVRRATGTRVQDHITERFLSPLGMTRTTWLQPDHDDWARPFKVVDGQSVDEGVPPLGDGEMAPMGGLWSTVRDLCRWVTFLDDAVSRPDATEPSPLSPASRRELQRMHTYIGQTSVAGRTSPAGYCFGLNTRDDPTIGTVVAHAGGLPGYGSNMRWLSGRGVGAIALANTTYAPMSPLTLQMLVALHEESEVPARHRVESPRLVDAVNRLVALLNEWDDATADALFTDNVALDEPYERRAAAAAALVAQHGPLTVVEVHPESFTSGAATVRGTGDDLRLTLDLAPLAASPIQFYELK